MPTPPQPPRRPGYYLFLPYYLLSSMTTPFTPLLATRRFRHWSETELKYLVANYRRHTNHELAEYLNRSPKSVSNKLGQLGLWHTRPLEAYKRGQFQANTKHPRAHAGKANLPDGSVRIFKQKGRGYTVEKVNGKWVQQQRLRWVAKHGPIPAGMLLVCRTAERTNSCPDNWKLLTKAEHTAAQNKLLKEVWEVARILHNAGRQHNSHIGRRVAAAAHRQAA